MRVVAVAFALAILVAAGSARAQTPDPASSAAATSSEASADPKAQNPDELDPAALFRAATDALVGGRPTEAIAKLEALGDRGVIDPVVSYNRGLAYAGRVRAGAGSEQPGDLGRAAHGFEEARELSRDATLVDDATKALAAVRAEIAKRRSRAGDPIEQESGVSLGRSIVRLLPESVWAILALIFAGAVAVGIVVRARATARRVAVAGTTTSAVAGGLLVIATIVLLSARDFRIHVREAVVIAPSARLLDDKHVAFVSVAPLPEGARVRLVEEGADFSHVVTGRAVGWLPSSALLPMAK